MTAPSMIVEEVELRARPSFLPLDHDPIDCEHVWEAQPESTRAQCVRCGSSAHLKESIP